MMTSKTAQSNKRRMVAAPAPPRLSARRTSLQFSCPRVGGKYRRSRGWGSSSARTGAGSPMPTRSFIVTTEMRPEPTALPQTSYPRMTTPAVCSPSASAPCNSIPFPTVTAPFEASRLRLSREATTKREVRSMGQSAPITAIDILLEPDATMVARAKLVNARLLAAFPQGFTLDASHQPHITMLQQFVRTGELESVYGAVEQVLASEPVGDW